MAPMIAAHAIPDFSYRERPGAGDVVVCLHGIGSNAAGFDALCAHLPADWRIISWDAPGYGGSTPLAQDWPEARHYAEALGRFLDALGVTEVSVIGHSLGTLMGAAFAAAEPERVRRLALLACAQGYGTRPGTVLPASAQARIDELEGLGARAFAEARGPRLIHRSEAHPELTRRIVEAMATVRMPGYAQAVRMLASGDLAADCARLSVATAILVGAEDVVTPEAQSRKAEAALAPQWRAGLAVLPGCGHALHQQDPETTARHIVAFWEETRHAA